MQVIRIKAEHRDEVERLLRSLPAILAGRAPDPYGLARGFRLRMAFMFLSLVREAYIVKSRGGTDECGIKWPKLSPEYLAYKRPMGQNGSGSRSPPVAGGLSPGRKRNGDQRDGFMSKDQLAAWRRNYGGALSRLVLGGMELGAAKAQAAQIAWARAKRSGVRTKLAVFGSRDVEILRDRGILFNSLSPGVLSERGVDADYSPPTADGGSFQVVRSEADGLYVGTAVEYAERHQNGKRPIWPKDGRLPAEWWEQILEVGASGLVMIGEIFKR